MNQDSTAKPFKWIGGVLCLDFNNTVDWEGLEPSGEEYLTEPSRLFAWAREARTVAADDWALLPRAEDLAGPGTPRLLEQARAWRRTLHLVLFPMASGASPVPEALAELNRFLADHPPQVAAAGPSDGYRWSAPRQRAPSSELLWPLAWSAARLITSPDLALLRTCANEHCGWLFLDRSRKHNRRWCEMGVCGNRAKVRRYYQRQRAASRRSSSGRGGSRS